MVFVHFDDSKWEALDELVVDENINRVNSGAWEGETLEANDEVAGHKGDIVRYLDWHGTFDGHLFVDGLAIFIDNAVIAPAMPSQAILRQRRDHIVQLPNFTGIVGFKDDMSASLLLCKGKLAQ